MLARNGADGSKNRRGKIPYRYLTPQPLKLPPRQRDKGYVRPPITDQTFVPESY
ncbi:MAG: hypothetical protein V1918_09910 [Planctomycetota bacterium]